MLDGFEVITTSGLVLWSRSYTPINASIINGFIKDVFIEERVLPGAGANVDVSAAKNPSYSRGQFTLKWATVKDLGLIFVAFYQSLLHLSWIDQLLDNIRIIFVDLYKDQLKKPYSSVVDCDFDGYFDQQIKELEGLADKGVLKAPEVFLGDLTPPSSSDNGYDEPPPVPGLLPGPTRALASNGDSTDVTPIPTPDNSRPNTPNASHLLSVRPGVKIGASRRARKVASSATASSGEEELRRKSVQVKGRLKTQRKWNADGMADEDDGTSLDYSAASPGEASRSGDDSLHRSTGLDSASMDSSGIKNGRGQYLLKDLDDEVHSMLKGENDRKAQPVSQPGRVLGSSLGVIGGLFRNVIGGKVLSKSDLEKPMRGMEEHLLKKNVAREAAVRLCEGVQMELIGVKTGSFESVETAIRTAMESSLRKILTPTTSLDILRAIASVTSPSTFSSISPARRPYVISIVGVNGVGKSTNLSKLAFFLLQNNFNLLIAACDTFRSGAVEQLRVHARNLKELSEREGLGKIELYEKGYGKDAANIAKDAVTYATTHQFDVVLIDTAGRRHNDARLMSSLEKFAMFAQPDKILMVGEALVGSDSVAQARSFNAAFGGTRKLDGFIISKCDTVGDMVGSLVSMVHATGIPVVFLGTGQHYGDLRTLNVSWAVKLLMS